MQLIMFQCYAYGTAYRGQNVKHPIVVTAGGGLPRIHRAVLSGGGLGTIYRERYRWDQHMGDSTKLEVVLLIDAGYTIYFYLW